MSTKEENTLAREFTLALPEAAEGLVFSVRGFPLTPKATARTVMWVRAREAGGDWGQSAWVEVLREGVEHLIDDYLYRSQVVQLGTLWLEPGKVYQIEITPEGLDEPQVSVRCMLRQPAPPPAPAPKGKPGDSVIDNPFFWLLVFGAAFMALLAWVLR